MDAIVAVYAASGDRGGALIVEGDSSAEGANESVQWSCTTGTSYVVEVRGFGASTGNFTAALDLPGNQPPDDNYENNDTQATAYYLRDRANTWLSAIDGPGIQVDDDWYKVSVAPGDKRLVAALTLTHAEGNIDLQLFDGAGNLLRTSASLSDSEVVDVTNPAAGTWYLRVYGAGAGNSYDLWTGNPWPSDATLNGKTDISDFNIWMKYRFQTGTDWTKGDFNGDGKTDISDLNIWMQNRFTVAPGALSQSTPQAALQNAPAATRDAVLVRSAHQQGNAPQSGSAKVNWLYQFEHAGIKRRGARKDGGLQAAVDRVLAAWQ